MNSNALQEGSGRNIQVGNDVVVVTVIAVGKRDKLRAYRAAHDRIE
ncbi:MAG: hypothetical protein ACREPJ_13310 [Rhodanobacteraceae bacterium]